MRGPRWPSRHGWGFLVGVAVASGSGLPAWGADAAPGRPDIVLVTLDTTRADALGIYGAPRPTPTFDALARGGVWFRRAITPAPLTLPAHASLLTGLEPPEHGLRDNGLATLGPEPETVATRFAELGYRTGAVVGSRVLDRRFGLDRGFEHYDDAMAAERRGEYGYPERPAAQVTDAALAWQDGLPGDAPFFLWVHYYDPHAPYEPPDGPGRAGSQREAYLAEVLYVDREVGRLLAGLPDRPRLVAVVGDHGEALGDHGERSHGLLIYEGVLRVPLILHGPGLPADREVIGPVGIRRLAPTLLDLVGSSEPPPGSGPPLAWSRERGEPSEPVEPGIYSETQMPATAYGWSPLMAWTEPGWRWVRAPRPELYDTDGDPGELSNLVARDRRRARIMQRRLAAYRQTLEPRPVAATAIDSELRETLESLGYLAGASRTTPVETPQGLDPKDGLALLDRLRLARERLARGETREVLPVLQELVAESPGNVPFLLSLAETELGLAVAEGADPTPALDRYRSALARQPHSEFVRLALARALLQIGRTSEAEAELERVLQLDPRQADAWQLRAQLAAARGGEAAEREILEAALKGEARSAAILTRLALLDEGDSSPEARRRAGRRLQQAAELYPEWPLPWFHLGRWQLGQGDTAAARVSLRRVLGLAPGSAEARAAARILETLAPPAAQ